MKTYHGAGLHLWILLEVFGPHFHLIPKFKSGKFSVVLQRNELFIVGSYTNCITFCGPGLVQRVAHPDGPRLHLLQKPYFQLSGYKLSQGGRQPPDFLRLLRCLFIPPGVTVLFLQSLFLFTTHRKSNDKLEDRLQPSLAWWANGFNRGYLKEHRSLKGRYITEQFHPSLEDNSQLLWASLHNLQQLHQRVSSQPEIA